MFLSYFTLFVALSLSAVAAWYSIIGLTAIFAAAIIPIVIMGSILEVAKLTATVWLHEHWNRCRWFMRLYLVSAVIILMIITSMGIFGFLSRAHIEQSAPIGDTAAQIEIIEEKIEIQQQVIAQYRQDLEILNQQIERFNQLGAVTRGVAARATQQAERETIFDQIAQSQQAITELRQQRAPLAADIRKIETEVGPIKYIAALIYGDNPDQDLLEKAVRWMIMLLVVVFDPLAIMLVLAATQSLKWERQKLVNTDKILSSAAQSDSEYQPPVSDSSEPLTVPTKSLLEQHPYLTAGFSNFKHLTPMVYRPDIFSNISTVAEDDEWLNEPPSVKAAMIKWKELNPGATLKDQRARLVRGEIHELPWMYLVVEHEAGFGPTMPVAANKGDTWVLTSVLPNKVYKHNGTKWISVDKSHTDNYTYNEAYLDHLISKIDSGEYDIDLLSANEQEQIAQCLQKKAT